MCQQVCRICVGRSTLFIIIKMAALSTDLIDGVYMIVNNIPKDYHASDLRKFFSSFIETGGFICFHFRHRPEVQKFSGPSQINGKEVSRRVTNCCIIKVKSERASEFLKSYNGEHWLDKKGDTLMTRCFVKKLILHQSSLVSEDVGVCKKGTVSSSLSIDKETFSQEDINALIEMHPPTCMPNGNVGTKTVHFLQEIKACRLPPSIITKLGLQFPRNRARRMYGTVPFDYINKRNNQKKNYYSNRIHSRGVWLQALQSSSRDTEEKTEDSESEEEEWDRHEALHDDVTGQERSKERLFEEEIELKWEKGGSGLVFYTDAQFWDAKEGDFDAKTADDWDIDTNIYKNPGMDCDKDSQDLLRMRLEQAVRDGTETKIDRLYDFAAFEKYNKGFGRKLMEAQGWKQGLGIGKNFAGISEPIFNDGQKPTDKKGFGYRGEKLNREPKLKKRRRRSFDSDTSFFISTVFDNPKVSDPPDSVFTSTAYSKLKYRRDFLKEHGNL